MTGALHVSEQLCDNKASVDYSQSGRYPAPPVSVTGGGMKEEVGADNRSVKYISASSGFSS